MAISVLICVLCILGLTAGQTALPGVQSCTVETISGIVDLSPLGKQDGTPRFKNVNGPEQDYTFSWNPCYGFQDAQPCQGVQLCQHGVTSSFNLGSDSSAEFVQNTTHLFLVYTTEDFVPRRSFIQLICDAEKEGKFDVVGEAPQTIYHFTLRSKYACAKGGSPTTRSLTTSGSNSTAVAPTAAPSPPSPDIFSLKTITILVGCILVSLCLLICLLFWGLITRRSKDDDDDEHHFHGKKKKMKF